MSDQMMRMLAEWAVAEDSAREAKFDGYVYGIAQARYVLRHVFRIVDQEAKRAGLEPLQHQTLLQAYGSGDRPLTIGALAERLDIVPAQMSRTVRELETAGFVERRPHPEDRRASIVHVTEDGQHLLRAVDSAVHVHVEYFQSQLDDDQRRAALVIMTFYVGLGSPARLEAILSSTT